MALDQAFFDAVELDVVKKKYYKAHKVDRLLEEIRAQALSLAEENTLLYQELESYKGQRSVIGETLLSAKAISQRIIQEAQEQAAQILAEAEKNREGIDEEDQRRRAALAEQAAACCIHMKQQLMNCVEDINGEWQDFLLRFDAAEEDAPADLEQKVDSIARELFAISAAGDD